MVLFIILLSFDILFSMIVISLTNFLISSVMVVSNNTYRI